ncbi:unnamed protein product [Colias eurytheme]|nr:unnamed protein product [Colias eurytheme]
MTGEGGYYFTNLCCAVSFIENLTSESLNMDKKEFDCYMAMPASLGGSTWAAALSLCGASREAEEQKLQVEKLLQETNCLKIKADQLATNAETFEKEIAKKVQDVLAKTPLEIKPRRELPRLGSLKSTGVLIDCDIENQTQNQQPLVANVPQANSVDQGTEVQSKIEQTYSNGVLAKNVEQNPPELVPQQTSQVPMNIQDIHQFEDETQRPQSEIPTKIKDTEPIITLSRTPDDGKSPSKSPLNPWELKQTSSLELLTPSPLGFTPFDSRSIDELLTPDEFGSDQAPGLSNINYDIDLSDFSGDNSLADDVPREPKDPFSPDPKKQYYTFEQRDPFSPVLDKFDEFSLVDTKTNETSEAFEVIHRASSSRDPFSPEIRDPFSLERPPGSILDDSNSPTSACLLPSPLLPQTSKPN